MGSKFINFTFDKGYVNKALSNVRVYCTVYNVHMYKEKPSTKTIEYYSGSERFGKEISAEYSTDRNII